MNMARQQVFMGLPLILAGILWAGVAAQSNDCTNVILSMSPCLSYITGNSTAPPPPSSCCTQLGTVVRSQPQCLCQVLSGGGSNLGLNINQTQALALPGACNVQTPPVSQCNVAVASPSGSPGSTPNSGGGSKTGPSTGGGTSGVTSIKLSSWTIFCFLLASVFVIA